jgi:hypothetical protein
LQAVNASEYLKIGWTVVPPLEDSRSGDKKTRLLLRKLSPSLGGGASESAALTICADEGAGEGDSQSLSEIVDSKGSNFLSR